MRIAMLGATGRIGSRIVREALDRGHRVTALVRDLRREVPDTVGKREADVADPESIADAVRGHDAVVSALGGSGGRAQVVAEAAGVLLEALPRAGVQRLLVVGGAGSLRWPHLPGVDGVDAPGFPAAWRPAALAQRRALAIYRAADTKVDWTYLSPADVIEPGLRTTRFTLGTDRFVVDRAGRSRISTEDYAVALVDELERGDFPQQRFTVGYGADDA
jgi:putative NADH-flavin reductase